MAIKPLKKIDWITVGAMVTRARKARGISQGEFATICGVAQGSVSRWETGVYTTPVDVLDYLGIIAFPSVVEGVPVVVIKEASIYEDD